MRKKKNIKSHRRLKAADLIVIVLCLLAAFFSFWFFWKDLHRSINHSTEPVGTITFKQRAAQRRLSERVLWDRLRRESPVYDGDFIRTAELSDATVTFNEGVELHLSETSLVQIRTIEGRAVIDLNSGAVTVTNPGNQVLVLVSGDKEVELSGTMKARALEDGSFEMEVLEGQALIRSEGETQVRETGQALFMGPGGEMRERPWVVMLLPLPDQELISAGETLEADFSWSPVNFAAGERTRLEIAGDRRFTRILESLVTENSAARAALPPGVYWWRAYPGSGGPENVSPEKLTILPAASSEQGFTVLNLPAAIWAEKPPTPPEKPEAPEPTPAAGPAPIPPARTEQAPPASPGPIPAARPEQAPAARPEITVAEGLLPAITGRQPENNYIVGPAQLRQSRNLVFRWKETPGANGYIFTLREESGGVIASTGPFAETSYTLDLRSMDQGNFFWQVEAVRRRGNIIERRGVPAENRFTLDIPLPGKPRTRAPGTLYGIDP